MWFARFPPHVAAEWVMSMGGTPWTAEDGSQACAYVQKAPGWPVPPETSWVRLEQTLDLAGEAHHREARWHYIVATDVLPDEEKNFNAWYDTEHLPGLAAVAGVVRARRYRVVEGAGPRYLATYDLAQRDAFNSPAWLAVRSTPWSAKVRPSFLNTRRTMYCRWT